MDFLDDVPIDAGGGDGGGGDSGGDIAIADEPIIDAPEGSDAPPDGEQPDAPIEGDQPKLDQRTAADAIKKGLTKLKEIDPTLAQEFRKQFFKQEGEVRQFREVFKTPAEAQAAAELLSVHGGPESIAKNAQEAEAYAAELTAFAEGRPEVIDNLARDYPESLPKLADYGLQKLAQINPKQFAATMARAMMPMLADKGVLSTLDELDRIVNEGGANAQRDAARLSKTLRDWFSGAQRLAESQPARREDDPREKELNERASKLTQQEQKVFHEQVGRATLTRMNTVLTAAMAPYLNGKKLTDPQKAGVYKDAMDAISTALQGNADYQTKLKSLIKQGNIQKIAQFVESHTKQRAGAAVKAAWANRGFGTAVARATNTSRAAAGTVVVGTKPDTSLIDWTKDPGRSRFMGEKDGGVTGEATLKDGTIRRWKW